MLHHLRERPDDVDSHFSSPSAPSLPSGGHNNHHQRHPHPSPSSLPPSAPRSASPVLRPMARASPTVFRQDPPPMVSHPLDFKALPVSNGFPFLVLEYNLMSLTA